MMPYLGVELERQRRSNLDDVATDGARRRRWQLEAREARRGKRKSTGNAPVMWVRPNWTPDWKVESATT